MSDGIRYLFDFRSVLFNYSSDDDQRANNSKYLNNLFRSIDIDNVKFYNQLIIHYLKV